MDPQTEQTQLSESSTIENANHAYSALEEISSAPDPKEKLSLLLKIKEFVDKNKATIPEKVLEGDKGVVSPSHYLEKCLEYANLALQDPDQNKVKDALIALDLAKRFLVHGEVRVTIDESQDSITQAQVDKLGVRKMDLPKIITFPRSWHESEGKEFVDLFSDFENRVKNNLLVSEKDLEDLTTMVHLLNVYMKVTTPFDKDEVPVAKTLNQVLLDLLKMQLNTQRGKPLNNGDTIEVINLIKGALHFNSDLIIANKQNVGGAAFPTPAIVRMPLNLKTRLN